MSDFLICGRCNARYYNDEGHDECEPTVPDLTPQARAEEVLAEHVPYRHEYSRIECECGEEFTEPPTLVSHRAHVATALVEAGLLADPLAQERLLVNLDTSRAALVRVTKQRDAARAELTAVERLADEWRDRAFRVEAELAEQKSATEYQKSLYLQAERFQIDAEREREKWERVAVEATAARDQQQEAKDKARGELAEVKAELEICERASQRNAEAHMAEFARRRQVEAELEDWKRGTGRC